MTIPGKSRKNARWMLNSLFCYNLLPTTWAGDPVDIDSLESWTTSLGVLDAPLVSVGQYTVVMPAQQAMHIVPDPCMLLKSG